VITSGKIVLLGGNGFIAKHLTAALIERGSSAEDNAEIVVVSRTGNGQLPKSVTEVTADVGNVSCLKIVRLWYIWRVNLHLQALPGCRWLS
jgi:nucleoside-diphosphate-sugar epimerase